MWTQLPERAWKIPISWAALEDAYVELFGDVKPLSPHRPPPVWDERFGTCLSDLQAEQVFEDTCSHLLTGNDDFNLLGVVFNA